MYYGRKIAALFLILVVSIWSGCLEDTEEVSLRIPEEQIEAPNITGIIVEDGTVTVNWNPVSGAEAYTVYRSVLSEENERLIAETGDTSHTDRGLINGRQYFYSVAGKGSHGLEGERSDWIAAMPSVYSVSVNQGEAYTNSVRARVYLTAPENTVLMMISNDSDFSGAFWETFTPARNWTLQPGDGQKTVYARFQDAEGGISSSVSGSITVDTFCGITAIDISPDQADFNPGDLIHFTMNVEEDESGGTGNILIEDYSEPIGLFDNGRGGDSNAGDGVYECDFRSPLSLRGKDLVVSGEFTDRAQNESPLFDSDETISFTDPPIAVELIGASDSTTSSITIRWVASSEDNFRSYRIYRDEMSHSQQDFESAEYFVDELFNRSQTGYPDTGLKEGIVYYYRIYVVNDMEETAGSNQVSVSTFDAVPEAVVLDTLSSVGTDRATLSWSVNQNSDFSQYRIYRSTSPGVSVDTGTNIATIDVREITWHDDIGIDLSTQNYYYRVFVYDNSGKYSRSNEVSTTD